MLNPPLCHVKGGRIKDWGEQMKDLLLETRTLKRRQINVNYVCVCIYINTIKYTAQIVLQSNLMGIREKGIIR